MLKKKKQRRRPSPSPPWPARREDTHRTPPPHTTPPRHHGRPGAECKSGGSTTDEDHDGLIQAETAVLAGERSTSQRRSGDGRNPSSRSDRQRSGKLPPTTPAERRRPTSTLRATAAPHLRRLRPADAGGGARDWAGVSGELLVPVAEEREREVGSGFACCFMTIFRSQR
jgi:hypothetical protein